MRWVPRSIYSHSTCCRVCPADAVLQSCKVDAGCAKCLEQAASI